jgi:hypothetical protein
MDRAQTEINILHEFDAWVKRRPPPGGRLTSGTEALVFFGFLNLERPHLLDFESSGDKWQTIHALLLRHGRVSD